MFEIAVLVVSATLNTLLGVVVYLKNPKSATNRLFFLLTSSFVAWSVINYISVHPILVDQLWWIRFVLFFAALLCLSVFLTFNVFPHYELPPSRWARKAAIIATILVMPLTLTPLVFKGLKVTNGNVQPIPNFGIPLFALLVIGLLGGGVVTLIKKYRHAHGAQKLQFRYVIFGLAGTFGLIVLTDFIFVVAFHNTKLVPLGPAYTLIFSTSLAYAIVKHRLFDIRAAVARALAYALSLGFIGLLYGFSVFAVSGLFSSNVSINASQRAFYIGFALLTALLFQRIKLFFDRVTNKIFFKDSYDPQLFIDRLNDILVRTIQLDTLLTQTSDLVGSTLKASYVAFVLTSHNQKPRVIGVGGKKPDDNAIHELVYALNHTHAKTVVTDELSDQGHLQSLLSHIDAAASVRLLTHQQHIGYLVLGFKQSGDAYQSKDLNMLEIISDETSLAIQNALRFEEIQQFNITLQEKVDEATKQLRQTNDKLRALDETKDEFISMASHQLRTPLTSVKGYVSMVLEGDGGKISKMQKELLSQAFASSQRMVYLIADLLNVSRLRTGKFVIENKPTQLADVIETELEQLVETAKARKLQLIYNKPKDFPVLMLDETKIRQVVMNFVDNAIYYTPSGGHITVNLADKGESIELTVVDDGLGVPKAEQHHLFTKFYRANNAKRARPDGTGLGLFMAKKVIMAQGGAVVFNSTEGKGSTFGFTFAKSHLAPLPPHFKKLESKTKALEIA